jgi:hypothetical protein
MTTDPSTRAVEEAADRIRERGGIITERTLGAEVYGKPIKDPREIEVDSQGFPIKPPEPDPSEVEAEEAKRQERHEAATKTRERAEREAAEADPQARVRAARKAELIASLSDQEREFAETTTGQGAVSFALWKQVRNGEDAARAQAEEAELLGDE